ncbi:MULTISPECIES: acetolactate synthase large subunit [Enterobacter]|uniref:acetolactate synthase large subunit n=1 Tax=Enterobacter TaxID=547 RepID=UPI000C7692CC|nr:MULTISPECIES: acetolactate synthase large subunit [Enterobacter]AUM05050.1 acetolactate synthase large subunit [Enterobacter sp. Crenshaw]MDU7450884.1 acetolactate synthase large subunit [Enterobacter sp.]MEA3941152.1 acetolactate synthase large subunit [Enterobacter ludwigii]QLA07550.1 acetolactate synthase large subunit [Enterobacter ludwigii]UVH62610.1 acetolactate synthase large subunit [Enterobacter sp. Crenshaw]
MAKASDIVVRCLESEGVEYVFGIPGEENLSLLESLRKSQIRLVLTRHEQSAGFMAATYGRLTGRAGVSLSTLGPGATNLATAGAYAYLGGMPMLMITGQKPIKKSRQSRFQIIDVCGMMAPITKYTHQFASADNIPSRMREAFRLAEEEKPGAVHLELPEDIASEQTDSIPIPRSLNRWPLAEHSAIDAAVAKLRKARSPILVIGAGASRKMPARALKKLIDKTGIPFVTTQLGKGVVDERHPRFVGNAALSTGDFVHRAFESADLIVNVGHDLSEKPPFLMVRGSTEVIHIDYRSAEADALYFPQLEVTGDIADAVWRIGDGLNNTVQWDFTRLLAIREANEAQIAEGADDDRYPVYPQRLVADIRRAMPSEGIVALDNGIYKIWFARNYKAHKPNTVLLDNALATMGAGLPSAMAAHLVYPDRPVIAVCGDGGFMMNSQELETALRLGMHITVVILRDDGYGMIRCKQTRMGYTEFGVGYGNPDFVKYAEAYGASGYRVESAGALLPLLERCIKTPGVHVIDCPVDYGENDRILNDELRARSLAV